MKREQLTDRLSQLEAMERQTFTAYQNAFADYNAVLGAKQVTEQILAAFDEGNGSETEALFSENGLEPALD